MMDLQAVQTSQSRQPCQYVAAYHPVPYQPDNGLADFVRALVVRSSLVFTGFASAPQATTNNPISRGMDSSDPEAWFWSEEWQAGETQALANIASGNGVYHDSDEDFLAAL